MRLYPNDSTKATSTHEKIRKSYRDSTLEELVAETFNTLEDNINDIIAFEEDAERMQNGFDRRRKMFETPSERYMAESLSSPQKTRTATKRISFSSDSAWMKEPPQDEEDDGDIQIVKPSSIIRGGTVPSAEKSKGVGTDASTDRIPNLPSQRALTELCEIAKTFEHPDMEIDGLRKELERVSGEYEVFRNNPFGIVDDASTALSNASPRRSRISFQSNQTPSFGNGNEVRGSILKRLSFLESSLKQHAAGELQDDGGDDQGAEGDANSPENIRLSFNYSAPAERRMSEVTIDADIKKAAVVAAKEDAKEKEEKSIGQRLREIVRGIQDWMRRQVEAFVASFTPKERLIVKQMV